MSILNEIISYKRREVEQREVEQPISELEQAPHFARATVSISEQLKRNDKLGIIAEFKRKSPSKGVINGKVSPYHIAEGYIAAGASAMSVLTDEKYFGGKDQDLLEARKAINAPILRKDFMISEYQIVEAKAMGADVILLIAAALSPMDLKNFAHFAQSLGLEVLLEVHNLSELQSHYCQFINVVGVNNRNLKTFEVSIEHSIQLAEYIPKEVVKISESGINDASAVKELIKHGYNGFLMGEHFMRQPDPAQACTEFIEQVNLLNS